jgi:hypothetical protein
MNEESTLYRIADNGTFIPLTPEEVAESYRRCIEWEKPNSSSIAFNEIRDWSSEELNAKR